MTVKEKIMALLEENQGRIELTTKELCEKVDGKQTNVNHSLHRMAAQGLIIYEVRGKANQSKLLIQDSSTNSSTRDNPTNQDSKATVGDIPSDDETIKAISNYEVRGKTNQSKLLIQDSSTNSSTRDNPTNQVSKATVGDIPSDDETIKAIMRYVAEVKSSIVKEFEKRISKLEEEMAQNVNDMKKICAYLHHKAAQQPLNQENRSYNNPTAKFNYLKEILEDTNKDFDEKEEASKELEELISSQTLSIKQQPYAESILERFKRDNKDVELKKRANRFNELRKFFGRLDFPSKEYEEEAEHLLNERDYFLELSKQKKLPQGLIDPAMLGHGVEAYAKAWKVVPKDFLDMKKRWLDAISKEPETINLELYKSDICDSFKEYPVSEELKAKAINEVFNAIENHDKKTA